LCFLLFFIFFDFFWRGAIGWFSVPNYGLSLSRD
jgi:hypothetical protein